MGFIAEKIEKIKLEEQLSSSEVFAKYPHLAELLLDEQKEESEKRVSEKLKESSKQILKG